MTEYRYVLNAEEETEPEVLVEWKLVQNGDAIMLQANGYTVARILPGAPLWMIGCLPELGFPRDSERRMKVAKDESCLPLIDLTKGAKE